jgi:hypothetical protein
MSRSTAEDRARAKALDYFKKRGTLAPIGEVRARVAAALEAFEAVVEPVDAATAAQRAWEGEWSVHEIVDHLLETYRPGLDELWCLLAGRRPPEPPIPARLQSKAPLLRPWPWLVRELKTLHRDVLATLDGLPPSFATDATAPLVMVVNVEDEGRMWAYDWVEELDWKTYTVVSFRLHAIDHMKQAQKVLATIGPGSAAAGDPRTSSTRPSAA